MPASTRLLAAVALLALAACRPPPIAPAARAAAAAPTTRAAAAAPASPPPLPGRAASAPADGAPVGSAHPTVLVGAAPDARWVVLCQARRDTNGDGKIEVQLGYHGDLYGDAMEQYLVRGEGPGEPIDDYVKGDRAGRHLVVIRAGRWLLIDTIAGTEIDLGARGADPLDSHRATSFDAAGRRMTYARQRPGGRTVVVVRDLESGAEAEIDPGPGLLWRAGLDPAGAWVHLLVVARDSDGSGGLELPSVQTSLARGRCRGPVTIFGVYGRSGDEPEARIAPAAGGAARAVPGLVAPLGRGLLVRAPRGALVWERPGAPPLTLVPAACSGVLAYRDEAREEVLVGCASKTSWGMPLQIHGASVHKALPAEARLSDDRSYWDGERLQEIDGAYGRMLVDVRRRRGFALDANDIVLQRHGARALVAHAGELDAKDLVLYDADTKQRRRIAGPVSPYSVVENGRMVVVGTVVVDLLAGEVLGAARGRACAVANDGRVLLATGGRGVYHGPLAWHPPAR